MNALLIALTAALLATNRPASVSNIIYQRTGMEVNVADPNDPVEKEFREVMIQDDDAQTEVDQWIRDNNRFDRQGAGIPRRELNQRIMTRFEPVRKAYEAFIARHPDHARARLAFASFLGDSHDLDAAVKQMEKARELDQKNPAAWNNLANHYGHYGELKKAFIYYEKAIELDPTEPIYYQNFGTTVFLFRKDAMEHYQITEQQVFDKALGLYRKAMKLAPDDFALATDVAQTYYGIRPWRIDEALGAWTNALKIAHNQVEREGVYVHMARIENVDGRLAQAAAHINAVTNAVYGQLRERVSQNIEANKAKALAGTNAPAATNPPAPAPETKAPELP